MSKWRPIKTAPKDGTHILLWIDDGTPIIGFFSTYGNEGEGYWVGEHYAHSGCGCCGDTMKVPTLWMTLPEPPQSEIKKNP